MLHSELGHTGFQPPHERRGFVHKKIGRLASKAAPFVGLIPGVGTALAAGLGAGGALLSGQGIGAALKSGARGALGGLAGGALSKFGGIGKVGGALGGFLKNNPELLAGGISAIQNARTQGERDKIRAELLQNSRVDRTRRQGFLNQIDVQGLRDVRAPDLGSVFADPNNPFARSGRTPDPAATGVVNPAVVPVTGGIKGAIKKARRARG